MSVSKEIFGKTRNGETVFCYTLENSKGMSAKVISFGAILKNLYVTDKHGKKQDVVLGYDKLWMYFKNGSCFGATVGPIANRTEAGAFQLDGKTYQMPVNDRGLNNLHTDLDYGFQKRVWKGEEGTNSVTFSLEKKDGEMGHPGTMQVKVTYTVTEENELRIDYYAETDKKTVINMTNHTYFNLSGQSSANMEHTKLTLFASNYTPIRVDAIPTGEIASVKNSPMDFTKEKAIGEEVNTKDFEQIKFCHGYDHNYVVDGWDGSMKKIAIARDLQSGITMETYTDLPGVQFYSGNWIGSNNGKEGCRNGKRKGFCLETQYYPNSANEKNFPAPIFDKNKPYATTTIYKFV